MSETLRVIGSLREIDRTEWDRLALLPEFEGNPFLSHDFLWSLEESKSANAKSGWAGSHLVLERDSKIAGVVPCYVKSHSQGEYVFDHGWAEAFQRAGGSYYPKLQVSVPFTPVPGPRLLAHSAQDRAILAKGLDALCRQSGTSSVHATFASLSDVAVLTSQHWLHRKDIQFHWHNNGYSSFDEFLASLSSSKRKNIRKERAHFLQANIEFEHCTGDSLTKHHWESFYEFYMDTGARKWGRPYLTPTFFDLMHERMRDKILLVMAKRQGRYIAGALNFIGSKRLYGRNWGCVETHPYLHFETCYYQAIDFAISRGLEVVEAGAQGEHKLARGYLPVETHSLHHISHPGLRHAIENYLESERLAIENEAQLLGAHSPFRSIEHE